MLLPRRTKFRKMHRGRRRGEAKGQSEVQFGEFGIKALENGWYACSVSIRSGSGRGTTDRVLRLTRLFRDPHSAADYARGEGLQWVGAPRVAAAA